jgi:hypothetical protein
MKIYNLYVPFILVCSTGCGTTLVNKSYPDVIEAISLQRKAVNDPLFVEVLNEMESKRAIDWDQNRTHSVKENLTSYSSNVEWALEQFSTRGLYTTSSVYLWRKWNPWSSTTAITNACGPNTKLNKWKLGRDSFSIANTLIHERGHSFCLTHPSQDRPTNKCDFNYVSGDLALSILAHKHGLKHQNFTTPMCPALCESLKSRDMPQGCQ